ncbi:hypothetical protein LTR41_005249 [Exophiala xenobiotica]|nr:hypothetical protein LTR41_005249 [Exophiala xenobiotica]KAK5409320.1 hypothetical protein LTR06_006893 [Exophiala xenobiotica]
MVMSSSPTALSSVSGASKSFNCTFTGCGKSFTRAEHLRRHALNHDKGQDTCPRCAVVFTRPDLLARHMARHAKKDDEAGGPGLGVLETRKRSTREPDGTVVTRPRKRAPRSNTRSISPKPVHGNTVNDDISYSTETDRGHPISPPPSLHDTPPQGFVVDQTSLVDPQLEAPSGHDTSWFLGDDSAVQTYTDDPSQWSTQTYTTTTISDQMSFDDLFYTDTASSFNIMPFSTNVNWLLDFTTSTELLNESTNSIIAIDPADTQLQHNSTSAFQNTKAVMPLLGGQSRQSAAPPQTNSLNDYSAGNVLQNGDLEDDSSSEMEFALHQSANSIDTTSQQEDLTSPGSSMRLTSRSRQLPLIDEASRGRVLELIAQARPMTIDGLVIDTSSSLLSPPAFQQYSDLFFTRFNVSYPLIHQATFEPSRTEALLLTAILLLGATYDGKEAHQMAVGVHDVLRARIIQHPLFNEQPELWILQTILLVDCFGTSRAGQKQHAMSNMFHGLLINLLRRADCQNVRNSSIEFCHDGSDLDAQWRQAMDAEQRKRLALLCFVWDTQHAVLFSQASCLSAIELRLSLPYDSDTWEAPTAEAWRESCDRNPPSLLFLTVLKAYLNPDVKARPRHLDGFSRVLILHGLMSVSSDLKRRDQISLGIETEAESPQERVRRAYDRWKADFDTFSLDMKLSKGYDAKKFIPFKTATLAMYRAAHIALNVEVLDLQIFAGARQILGKPVTPLDYERSRKIIHTWLISEATRTIVGRAAWHACRVLRDAIIDLDEGDLTDLFHYPWCLYLATLICWAFHSGGGASPNAASNVKQAAWQAKNLDSKSEMTALISGMGSCTSVEDLNKAAGSYRTQGMIALMVNQLASVRWAAMHEGTKVLKALGRSYCTNSNRDF